MEAMLTEIISAMNGFLQSKLEYLDKHYVEIRMKELQNTLKISEELQRQGYEIEIIPEDVF